MQGLDQLISHLSHGQAPLVVLAVAVVLGLRHAFDPDHLIAVSTLVASKKERSLRSAALLGASWGAGHACSLVALGVPIVVFDAYLPRPVQDAAEVLVGVMIVALASQLLLRWRRGAFHAHAHAHGNVRHRHLHGHADAHAHAHPHATRSPAQAFGVGVLHGAGGSAGVGILLLASIGNPATALAALLLFAFAAAASMAGLSTVLGHTLGREAVRGRLHVLTPVLGGLSLAFGVLYAAGAVGSFF